MQKIIAALVLCLFVAAAARAQDVPQGVRIHGGYVSGTEYLDMSAQQREAYVAGLIGGMKLAPNFGASPASVDWLNGCLTVLNRAEIADRIYDKLFADTKLWDNRNAAKMYRAVAAACHAAVSGKRSAAAAPFTVRDYVSMGGLDKKAFVSGVLEGMLLAPAFGAEDSKMAWFLTCTEVLDRIKLRAKINAYVMAHSEGWQDTAPTAYYQAIVDACRDEAAQRPQSSGR